jgi:[ribosomal protein S5]-alanine N-acetyltransferase
VALTAPARLAGEGVVLRPLRADDAPAFAAAFVDDPELGRLVGFEKDPTAASVRERLVSAPEGEGFELTVTTDGSDVLRGTVTVHHIKRDHGRAELGFWLVSAARGAGLGSRAVGLAVDWLFGHDWFRRVEISTTPDNAGAHALARSLGFTHEGVQRQRVIERGKPVDIVWFGLLRDEWRR